MRMIATINSRRMIEQHLSQPVGSSLLRDRLQQVLCSHYNGDILYFFAVAAGGIKALFLTMPKSTPIQSLIEIWVDQQLAS